VARQRRGVSVPIQMLRYDPNLKRRARQLRKESTLAEVLLWQHLKKRQRRGIDFHRQKPIDEFIVDFFAPKLMLAVEIDGESHRLKDREDLKRQRKLEALGIRFLRFNDLQVKTRIDCAVQAIDDWIEVWEKQEKNQT
jgi:very-short-patch-repair endonuclease